MRLLRLLSWLCAGALCAGAAVAQSGEELLSSKGCLACHDPVAKKVGPSFADIADKYKADKDAHAKLVTVLREGKGHPVKVEASDGELKAIVQQALAAKQPESAKAGTEKPDAAACLACHGTAGFSGKGADGKQRSFHVDPEKFKQTKHGFAACVDCHVNVKVIPHQITSESLSEWRLTIAYACRTCHDKQAKEYATSVHGKEALEKKNPAAATCIRCHVGPDFQPAAHDFRSPAHDTTRLGIVKNCGTCHNEQFNTYIKTYHGQVHTLGFAYTAKCFDCHGSHGIQRVSDPASTVHPNNRLQTCQTCHKGATAGFVTFQPHGNSHDRERYPLLWGTALFMVLLLAGVFAFFWTHVALWFYREYRERKARVARPHVDLEALPPEMRHKQFERFALPWRIAHLVLLLSVMTLVLTGTTVLFAESAWAPTVIKGFGSPKVAAALHRIAATIFIGVFLWHLFYLAIRMRGAGKPFELFGPASLVPNLQDLKDIIGMFRWFLGKGPRPQFDRWTYWEKFDYWAVFWGVAVIGGSGLVLWFPNQVASVLPGWVFNIATIFHAEEAILAAVFLFTVHFFNNHFRPDKFPLDIVMFTGRMPLEEFKREHALEYKRLLASGALSKYLVDAPSRPFTLGSKLLGFTLIAIGLTLLVLVISGWFGGLFSS